MKAIPKYQTRISLFDRDGLAQKFSSLKDVYKKLGLLWVSNNVGKHFVEFSHEKLSYHHDIWCGYAPVYKRHDYILRDDAGNPVVYQDVYNYYLTSGEYTPHVRYKSIQFYMSVWNGEGAVPGTGKVRGGHWYRKRIRYIGAKKQAQFFEEEGELAPRATRKAKQIKVPEDLYARHCSSTRSWKKHRKTQYKIK